MQVIADEAAFDDAVAAVNALWQTAHREQWSQMKRVLVGYMLLYLSETAEPSAAGLRAFVVKASAVLRPVLEA